MKKSVSRPTGKSYVNSPEPYTRTSQPIAVRLRTEDESALVKAIRSNYQLPESEGNQRLNVSIRVSNKVLFLLAEAAMGNTCTLDRVCEELVEESCYLCELANGDKVIGGGGQ